MREPRPIRALLIHSTQRVHGSPLGLNTSPASLLQGSAQEVYGAMLWPANGILGKPHWPSSQGPTTRPNIPNGSLRPEAQALPERGGGWGLGRTGMGPSAAVTHPVISWTFIHFPLNYVLLKMVLFGFFTALACSRLLCVPGNC